MKPIADPGLYGMVVEFDAAEPLLEAAHHAREAGYRHMEGYSPFPVEGLAETLGHERTRLPFLTLLGGLIGGIGGYAMMYYASAIGVPLNIGGRPYNSWPTFIPITFELTILCAAFFSVLGMLALNGLPQPYHPLFNLEEFRRASRDRFFLSIKATDPKFDPVGTRQFLEGLNGLAVFEVQP